VVAAVLVQLERQDGHPRSGRSFLRRAGSGRHWAGPCNKVALARWLDKDGRQVLVD